jgi:hypothetical protein
MSARTMTRPEVTEPESRAGRQATAEITARICLMLPVTAIITAATGLATGAIILARRHLKR